MTDKQGMVDKHHSKFTLGATGVTTVISLVLLDVFLMYHSNGRFTNMAQKVRDHPWILGALAGVSDSIVRHGNSEHSAPLLAKHAAMGAVSGELLGTIYKCIRKDPLNPKCWLELQSTL